MLENSKRHYDLSTNPWIITRDVEMVLEGVSLSDSATYLDCLEIWQKNNHSYQNSYFSKNRNGANS
jgi:hypothetical protein